MAVRRQINRRVGRQGSIVTLPSPTAGLNLRDDISALRPDEAQVLINWVPDLGRVEPRLGRSDYSTSVGSDKVGSIEYFKGAASTKAIAVANGTLYDVSSSTASTINAGGYSSDFWVFQNYNGYIFGVNGTDTPIRYDGSSHSAHGFTGVTATNLATVSLYNNRLWFTVNNSADVYYAGTGAVTGALTLFGLAEIASGGNCQQIARWSRSGGEGVDDYIVFIMSTGELIVYTGDPAGTFTLVGIYNGFPPIGRRCWFSVGGEPIIITFGGAYPIAEFIRRYNADNNVAADPSEFPIWGKIAPGIAADAIRYSGLDGWSGIFFNGLAIINVPIISTGQSKQYVLNTRNSAWTQFDLPASQFAANNDELIFSRLSGAKVSEYTGNNDDSDPILLTSRQGNVPSPDGLNKRITQARPFITAKGSVRGIIDADIDFAEKPFAGDFNDFVSEIGGGTTWGDAWDGEWAGGVVIQNNWYTVNGQGANMSLIALMSTSAKDVRWNRTQVMITPAGVR